MIVRIDGKQFDLSLFELQEAMEKAESDAGLKSTHPTIELLQTIATWAYRRFSVKLSLTAAWQLWWAVCELIDSTRKTYQRIADVGAWLHIDATQLGDDQLFGLLANIPRTKAQHTLQSGRLDAIDHEGVYQIVLLATGSEKQAAEARYKALEHLVDSRCGGGS